MPSKDKIQQQAKRPFRHSAGKGSQRRPGDDEAYRQNYDRIFRKKKKKEQADQSEG